MASTISIIIRARDEASDVFSRIAGSANRLDQVGRSLTRNLTVPLVGIGTAGVLAATELDSAMRNIQSVGGQTEAQLSALSRTFVAMSTDAAYGAASASELAEAFYDIQGAGFAGEEAMNVLRASATAAGAGATDVSTAMEGVTAVLNAFGMGAENATHVSDVMFRAVDRGVGSFEGLSGSLSSVVGVANSMGVPFETVAAAMATMTKQGQSWDEASTNLNGTLLGLLDPSEAMSKALADIGYSSGLAAVQSLGFDGVLNALAQHTGGSAEAMNALFGNVRGLRGALALTGAGARLFADDLVAMQNVAGSAAAANAIQMQSFANQFQLFKNQVTAALIAIGNALFPMLIALMNLLEPVFRSLAQADSGLLTWIVRLGALVAVLGPVMIILAQLISAFTTIKTAIVAVRAAMIAMNVAALMNPWTIAILAFAAAALLIITNWDRVKQFFTRLLDFLRSLPSIMFQLGKAMIIGLANGMISAFNAVAGAVRDVGGRVIGGVRDLFGISSPSKVMFDMGQQVAQGLANGMNRGFDVTGGVQPLAASVGQFGAAAGAGAGSGGGSATINIQNLTVPEGTSREQVDYLLREIGQRVTQRGLSGRTVSR